MLGHSSMSNNISFFLSLRQQKIVKLFMITAFFSMIFQMRKSITEYKVRMFIAKSALTAFNDDFTDLLEYFTTTTPSVGDVRLIILTHKKASSLHYL